MKPRHWRTRNQMINDWRDHSAGPGRFGNGPKAKAAKGPGRIGTYKVGGSMWGYRARPCGKAQAELAARDARNEKARLIALRKGRNGRLLGLRPDLEPLTGHE